MFRDLVCVTITFKTTVPSAPALAASRTSHRSAELADRGRWHRSRVSRVLPEHRGAYAVRSTRGLLRRFCAAFAAPRGCCTSTSMSSNVLLRCGTRDRRIHGFLAVFARHRRASIWACMVLAWCMHSTSKTIVCDLLQLASTTTELSRAAAAFRSSTRRLQPLQHILGGLRLHAEWPNVSTFSDLHADYDMLFGIGLRSWMRHRELYPTTESFHDVDGTPRRQSRKTACLRKIGADSQTYAT